MKLARFSVDEWESYGAVEGDRVRVIQGNIFGEHKFTKVTYPLDRVKFLPPTSPKAFWAIGLNYAAHIAHQEQALDTERIQAERKAAMQAAMRKVLGDAAPRQGKVALEIAPLIDNGNAVPITVTVESPMTQTDHVKAIHVFTEKNPQPNVLSARLGPRAGRAAVSSRMRLADTQTVHAIAELSDGSFWWGSADVVVTVSACLEEGPI